MKKYSPFILLLLLIFSAGCQNSKDQCPMKANAITPPVIKTDAEPVRLISIIPAFTGNEEYLADLLRERYQRTGITDYALSCSLHPQGEQPIKKPQRIAKTFRKLKKLLKDTPQIRLGMLFQSLIGHGAVYNRNTQCAMPGTRLLQLDGKENLLYCPNDKNFLKYIDEAVTLMAKEGPAFCLTDDDVRLTEKYCACRLHLADVSRRTGIKVTRQRLVKAMANAVDPEDAQRGVPVIRKTGELNEDERIVKAFAESKIASVDNLCKVVRTALDRVDPKIACGSCMWYEVQYINSRVKITTGNAGSPLLRVSSGLYLELAVKDLALRMGWTGIQQVMFGNKGWTLLDEADTCPHNRYSKTARTMHLHLAVGIAQGLDGGKMWFDQGAHPLREVSLPYEEIVGKHQGFYRELRRLVKTWKPLGVVTRVAPPERGTPNAEEWNSKSFNNMGIPGFHGDLHADGITSLAGIQVRHFTDEELKKILSGKVLIDGEAAEALSLRGFSSLTGVKAEKKSIAVSSEKCLLTGISNPFVASAGQVFFKRLPGSEVLGEVVLKNPAGGQPKKVMPGTVYFENKLGGKIITSAMLMRHWHFMHVLTPGRKLVYLAWMKKLGGLPCYAPEDISVKLFAGKTTDGALGAAVFNFSYDPFAVKLVVEKPVRRVLELQPEGDWKEISFSFDKGILSIDRELATAGIGIYKLFEK